MSNADTRPTSPATPATTGARVDRTESRAVASVGSEAHGKNTISDNVVSKVAGIAAREVPGVFALGGGASRALGAIRGAVGQDDLSQGIKVEVGETQAAVDITIVVEYPAPIQQVADAVRTQVTTAITNLVGLDVVEVNVAVNDVHLPTDDQDEQAEARVS
ncbi:Asp23/Gls24 family envelope stress response protein [Cryobacterium sp. PAMC25264]|uniref:Asp23/Gls24 family envelope stress response protein n=1 Tax=Cryobacterium sp. PAMC25264 TaxID=2861288 RepID=UPI001C62A01D|nr:Asp23/Gls24 family envelope stress response protein [Cryobacterium sp. PAMC25264]QYF72939.1 Asp23/Gls24 family envelope stress response protein [Cryobacterium sp. PAMC25264]